MSRDDYPREAAADCFLTEHSAARELEDFLQTADQTDARHGVWALLLRTHPPVEQRLVRTRAALATDPAPGQRRPPQITLPTAAADNPSAGSGRLV